MNNEVLILPYSIDFDGCLAKSVWPDPGEGPPIEANLAKLNEVREAGHNISIHTARPWSDYAKLERWLSAHKVPYDAIICGKYLAMKYVDDRALDSESPSWL